MVDSPGVRRRISRRTVRPPTPESKTPMGLESVTRADAPPRPAAQTRPLPRGRELGPPTAGPPARSGDELARDVDDVQADAGIGLGDHERRALVAGRAHDRAVRADLVLRLAPEGLAQVGRVDARTRVGAVHEVLDLARRVADLLER